jgi:hypothetical protein
LARLRHERCDMKRMVIVCHFSEGRDVLVVHPLRRHKQALADHDVFEDQILAR